MVKLTIVTNENTGNKFTVDEHAGRGEMEQAEPGFFKLHGNRKRETFSVYRGCLIVRHTVKFSHGSERRTVAYMFGSWDDDKDHKSTFCLSAGSRCDSIRDAKKLIDTVLDGGKYHYGI